MDRLSLFSPDTLWALLPNTLEAAVRGCDGVPAEEAFRSPDQNLLAAEFQAAHPATEELPGAFIARIANGVAILPVYGVIRPRPIFSWFSMFSMSTNLATLTHDLQVALEDDRVETILLDVDSPGGMVTGTSEFADLVYKARERKRVTAYVQGMGASAAYWISSAADEVVINATADVGSIGVVASFIDFKEFDKKIGIREIEIVNSESPLKRVDPASDKGREVILVRLNDIADVFFESIGRNRGVDKETVIQEFGRGDLAVGARAVEMGLADRISTFDDLFEELSQPSATGGNSMLNRKDAKPTASEQTSGQEAEIKTTQDLAAAYPNLCEEIAKASYAEGEKAGKAAGIEEGVAKGAEQERERIKAIEDMAVPGLGKYINEAKFDPEATADSVAKESMRRLKAGEVDQAEIRGQDEEDPITGIGGSAPETAEIDELVKSAAAAANGSR